MPRYLLRYIAESCLRGQADAIISYGGIDVRLLLTPKWTNDGYLRLEIEIDATNSAQAQAQAGGTYLPVILDALSFATGTPLLLLDCELVLKDESGHKTRKAIFVAHVRHPAQVTLSAEAVAEVKALLQQGEPVRIALCWHRYGLHRRLALDKFVFNWLAFEALAGDAQVASRCPVCHDPVSHCGEPVVHSGADRKAAYEMFSSVNPDVSKSQFNSRVWGEARNKVFHGRKYPNPVYLSDLHSISGFVRKASERRIADLAKIQAVRPVPDYDDSFRVFYFVEWDTNDSAQAFAHDWPEVALREKAAEAELGRVYVEAVPRTYKLYNKPWPMW